MGNIGTGHGEPQSQVRLWCKRILEQADSGTARPQFLKEVAEILLEYTECEKTRFVLKDRDRRYWCQLSNEPGRPFLFEVTSKLEQPHARLSFTNGSDHRLEQLCQDIMAMKVDRSQPWFTGYGSFVTGDISAHAGGAYEDSGSDTGPWIQVDHAWRSMTLIPVDSGQERIGLVQLGSEQRDLFPPHLMEDIERLVQTFGIGLAHRRLQVALRERVKELTCLYRIAQLAAQPALSLEELLQQTVELLPPALLYPDAASSRIELDDCSYTARGYRKPAQTMTSDIVVRGASRGHVEVGYVWEKPELDEGPFLNEERHLIDTIARDISIIVERKQAEEEKLRLQEQLLHADRLATIGQLGASVAHELNEPMVSILGFAQLALKDPQVDGQTRHDLERIVSSTLHARDVISKLLTFARQTAPVKEKVDLNTLIEDGLQFLRSRCLKAGIDVVCNFAAHLPQITADRPQLLQILTNLVVNSIQAMPDGGRLTVVTALEVGRVLLIVEDDGVGMTEAVTRRVFEPFFTTKKADQGTGLGLSVVHQIVTSHGGSIDVTSELGRGTRFVVRLPVAATDVPMEDQDG